MALYVFYIWCVTVFMFRTRVRSIKTGQVPLKYFKAYASEPPPEHVMVVGRHYDNQFQVPLLFLVTCALCIALGAVNTLTLVLAWAFVISRGFHAWIHLGSNHLQKRVMAFAAGWVAVLLLWAQLVYFALTLS